MRPNFAAIPKAAGLSPAVKQDELDLAKALTVLAEEGLLHPDDIQSERARILLPSWKIDSLIWKAVRRHANTSIGR